MQNFDSFSENFVLSGKLGLYNIGHIFPFRLFLEITQWTLSKALQSDLTPASFREGAGTPLKAPFLSTRTRKENSNRKQQDQHRHFSQTVWELRAKAASTHQGFPLHFRVWNLGEFGFWAKLMFAEHNDCFNQILKAHLSHILGFLSPQRSLSVGQTGYQGLLFHSILSKAKIVSKP